MARRNHPRNRPQASKSRRHALVFTAPRIRVVRCPTGKVGFPRYIAEIKLEAYTSDLSNRHKVPQRIYECPQCDSWHLTSAPALVGVAA